MQKVFNAHLATAQCASGFFVNYLYVIQLRGCAIPRPLCTTGDTTGGTTGGPTGVLPGCTTGGPTGVLPGGTTGDTTTCLRVQVICMGQAA